MKVGILLVTHSKVGDALLEAVSTTYDGLPLPAGVVAVDYNIDPNNLLPLLNSQIKQLNQGMGVLVLTDLYGSTPCNLAQSLQSPTSQDIQVVAGLNLPMLMRVMNYDNQNLETLTEKACSGGRDGVMKCQHVK